MVGVELIFPFCFNFPAFPEIYRFPEMGKTGNGNKNIDSFYSYDVVDNGSSRLEYADQEVAVENEDSEAATEEVIIIQDVFESQKVNIDQTSANFEPSNLPVNEKKVEKEIEPIIVYPEGTISQPGGGVSYDDRPAPVYPSPANKPPPPQYAPRAPPPPPRAAPHHSPEGPTVHPHRILGDPRLPQNTCPRCQGKDHPRHPRVALLENQSKKME